jgi:hypothetical protein
MAHFYAPRGATAGDYDIDDKRAPGSVWRMRVPASEQRTIVLFDGTRGNELTLKSSNPAVVPNDGFDDIACGPNRSITFSGLAPGTSKIEVSHGWSTWLTLQVDVTSDSDQKGAWTRIHKQVTPMGQGTASVCWLTCFYMLFDWKGISKDLILPRLASAGIDVDRAKIKGLLPEDNQKAADALGLSYVLGHPLTAQDFRQHLYWSPLWACGEWFKDGLHARVVTGVSNDNIEYIDPWYGGTDGMYLDHSDTISNFAHGGGKGITAMDLPRLQGRAVMLYWRPGATGPSP